MAVRVAMRRLFQNSLVVGIRRQINKDNVSVDNAACRDATRMGNAWKSGVLGLRVPGRSAIGAFSFLVAWCSLTSNHVPFNSLLFFYFNFLYYRCRKKMKRVERRGTMDANAAMAAVHGRVQSRTTPQQSSTAPNSASPPATSGPGADHPRRPTSPSPLRREGTLVAGDSERERNGTMVSSSAPGFGGSGLRANGDSMAMGHSRRGSPVRERERDRARLGDRSSSSTASTLVGGNVQNGHGYPSNGKIVSSLHPSLSNGNGRRIPTPPYINSISSREQHGHPDGDDDDEHDDADMDYDGGERDLLEMIDSSPPTSATRVSKLDVRSKMALLDSHHPQSPMTNAIQRPRLKHLTVNGMNGSMNHQYRRLSTGDELEMDADGDGEADPDADIMEAVDAAGKDELIGEMKEEDV